MALFFQKTLFFILIGVLFVEVLLVGSQYLERQEELPPQAQGLLSHAADQKMERVHLVEGLGATKEWELFAETAEGFLGQGVWNLEKVKVIFYANTGDSYTVKGARGQIDVGSKNIDIVGDVSTHSTNGYEFYTPALHYLSKNKILSVPENLTLRGPKDRLGQRLRLKGRGITTYLDKSLMNIESDVVAERQMSNGKILKIQSRKAQLSGSSNMVRFFDSVKVYYDTFSINGPEALFAYKKGLDLPDAIVITGGVQVADTEKKATAENVQIDIEENKYTLKGSPKLIQGNDEMAGEEIIFIDGGKKVKVEGIKARVQKSQEVK